MSIRDTILGERRDAIRQTAARHGAVRIALFGSVAKGEDTEASDCDFLVDFGPRANWVDIVTLQDSLESLLGRPTDVLAISRLRERHRCIAEDAIVL